MKVAFSGFSGVGKTYIAQKVYKNISKQFDTVFIPSVSGKMLPELKDKPLKERQKILLDCFILEHNHKEYNSEIIIFDRSIFDVIAHSKIFGIETPEFEEVPNPYKFVFLVHNDDIDFLEKNFYNNLEKYKKIFGSFNHYLKLKNEYYKVFKKSKIKTIDVYNLIDKNKTIGV